MHWSRMVVAMPLPAPNRYAFINLPHAHTILGRLVQRLASQQEPPFEETHLPDLLAELDRLLRPYVEDPPAEEAVRAADAVAVVARQLVGEIESAGYRSEEHTS